MGPVLRVEDKPARKTTRPGGFSWLALGTFHDDLMAVVDQPVEQRHGDLLLRRNLHRLFDLGLIAVNPATETLGPLDGGSAPGQAGSRTVVAGQTVHDIPFPRGIFCCNSYTTDMGFQSYIVSLSQLRKEPHQAYLASGYSSGVARHPNPARRRPRRPSRARSPQRADGVAGGGSSSPAARHSDASADFPRTRGGVRVPARPTVAGSSRRPTPSPTAARRRIRPRGRAAATRR